MSKQSTAQSDARTPFQKFDDLAHRVFNAGRTAPEKPPAKSSKAKRSKSK